MTKLNLIGFTFNDIEISIFIFILTIISSISIYILSRKLAKFISHYSEDMDSDHIMRLIRPPLTYTIIYIGLWFVIQFISIPVQFSQVADSLGMTILLLIWSRTVYISGRRMIKNIVEYRYDENIVPIALNVWTFSTIVFGILFIFEIWNFDITPILASAGVFGIIIGFAARETISNFFGSIALHADNTYQKGDYIEIDESDAQGFVKDISIRSTELRTLDNNIVTIPNSKLHKSIIKNRSDPTDSHRIELEVGISYNTEPQKAKDIIDSSISNAIEKSDNVAIRSIDNYRVFVKDFGDSAILYRIFVWIKYPNQDPIVRDELQKIIYNSLHNENIEIPYPQRTVHFNNDNEIDDNDNKIQESKN